MSLDRRKLVAGALALAGSQAARPAGAASAVTTAFSGPLDDRTRLWLRLVADMSGRTTFAVEQGSVWGFKPQADDLTTADFAKRLYGYTGLVARKVEAGPDGVALKTKGWTFYTDAETGAIVSEVLNPYTGKRVQCPPLSGPMFTARYGGGPSAAPPLDLRIRRVGDHAWVEISRVARFKPADTTWFKLEADLVSYACRASDLDDLAATFVPSTWSHNVVAEWQTWMQMHGQPGHILFKGDGAFVGRLSEAPAPLLAAIDQHFPTTLDSVRAWN